MIRNFLLSAAAVAATTYLLPNAYIEGGFTTQGFVNLLIVVLVLGIVNTFIKPIIKVISLPITILTLGLFSFVISGAMVWITDKVLNTFTAGGFWGAVIFAVVLALVQIVLSIFENDDK